MSIKCLIVDDEPLSLDVLEKYISDVPGLELAGKCLNAFEAIEKLQEIQIDILFLDINMPKLSGINMVKTIPHLPEVIFTTAYPEYAVEGFELEVLDYLVKPISFERFLKAIQKARAKILPGKGSAMVSFIMIKANKKLHKVFHSDIKYIQSSGDFVKIHTTSKVHICSETLKNIEQQLPENQFVRIHKSYLISLDFINYLEGNQVKIEEEFLPIGLTYKENLLKLLDFKNDR